MKDYIYWCEYDDAKTGTRITIELYKATGSNTINKSDSNRIELPYNTLSVQNIDYILNDVRIGLSAPCYATVDVDFSTLKNTEHYEDFQEAILFPQKKYTLTSTSTGTANTIIKDEFIGTTWHIYEQLPLANVAGFGEKRLIFTGQHIVGLQGEFNFSKNQITVQVENIVSFVMKRMRFEIIMDNYRRNFIHGITGYRMDKVPQVFFHCVDNDTASGGGRRALMFSTWNMNENKNNLSNNVETDIGRIRCFDMGSAIIFIWSLYDLLRHIRKSIEQAIYNVTRRYNEIPTDSNLDKLENILKYSIPLYKQSYDNSGDLGDDLRDDADNLYIIGQIRSAKDNPETRLYYDIISADGKLRRDGRYINIFDFITDLLTPFCVYANFSNWGITLTNLATVGTKQLIIDLDTDGVAYNIHLGLSKYSKLDISNLEFYSEDVRDMQHEDSYTDSENGFNIVTVFHNQPPNNKEGWAILRSNFPAVSKADFAGSFGIAKSYGFWGSSTPGGYVFDILKQYNRLGEKFALNLFYKRELAGSMIEEIITTTVTEIYAVISTYEGRGVFIDGKWFYEVADTGYIEINGKKFTIIYDAYPLNGVDFYYIEYKREKTEMIERVGTWQDNKYIAVHNGAEGIKINYPNQDTIIQGNRDIEIAKNILEIKEKGCMHNTIATYINACFPSSDKYPFCVMTLEIPVKELMKIFISNDAYDINSGEYEDFADLIVRDKWSFILRTKNKIAGRQLSANDVWYAYTCKYNVSNGTYELVLHNVSK